MCRVFQRPFAQPSTGIGAWQVGMLSSNLFLLQTLLYLQIAFEFMSVMAVMTNCAIVALTPQGLKYAGDIGEVNYLLVFVVAEVCFSKLSYPVPNLLSPQHVLLFVKFTLSYLIPDEPQWVETALAQTAYHSKLAFRAQVL
jgi:anoctamin-10